MLEFTTINYWDEKIWKGAGYIYHQAFKNGAKPDKIIRNMFSKGICFLHLLKKNNEIIGIAITGKLKKTNIILIDYMAVLKEYQHHGYGSKLINYIKEWALSSQLKSMIIEVEAEKTPESLSRIDFWKQCGFILTDYIHQYIWVPEPYQAMYLALMPNEELPKKGEDLFAIIGDFHKQSFQKG